MNTYAVIPLNMAPIDLPKSDAAPWYFVNNGTSYVGIEYCEKSVLPDLQGWIIFVGSEEFNKWIDQ